MSSKITPVRKQYLEIKQQYPDAILFFRLGDFYETFDDDAELISRELDIVLTSRNIAKGARIPMAGIPHHAAESYLSKLIEKGYHVAICEQIGDGPVKGLFPREVVRVITPGTIVEAELMPHDGNNYLMAMFPGDQDLGIAYADVSTGEFAAAQFDEVVVGEALFQELERLLPAELLLPESWSDLIMWDGNQTTIPDWRFEYDRSVELLLDHLKAGSLDGFGMGEKPLAVQAAGAILEYLRQTQEAVLPLLTGLHSYSADDFMVLDASTRRNLELTSTLRTHSVEGSLLGVMDDTVTVMGKRLLRSWLGKPLVKLTNIESRLNQVEAFFEDGVWRLEVRDKLKPIVDLERLINRIVAGAARPRDLVALRENLPRIPEISKLIIRKGSPDLASIHEDLDPCEDVGDLLNRAITEEPPATMSNIGIIREGYSQELDEITDASRSARQWIADLESVERERTGIKNLKVGYNKVFGYYIEITKSHIEQAPEEYIRKQTLVNAERYITPEMKDYESLVLTADERIRDLEARLFRELCEQVGEQAERLLCTARALAHIDVISALAEVASIKGYVRPVLFEDQTLEIREGRHPVVEEVLPGHRFVPNDTNFETDERIRIITGPNMSGKSTYLRQVALITLMAQMGSFVPASSAELGITDRIFTRIGAQDEIHAGQSTFMVEMIETANILNHATNRSLLILDEIGRGTSTYDGVSIAWAVVEYIHNHPRLRARTLFATHYHELTRLAEVLPGVSNYNVVVSEEGGQVVFLHIIAPGGADKSYGIHVAELAGIPRAVINRAQEILSQFESGADQERGWDSAPMHQISMFPDSTPLLEELDEVDISSLSPLDALNLLYEWQQRYLNENANLDGGDEAED
jgi:DNA mismatch repair protein MutS